jgi:hypothetical protein
MVVMGVVVGEGDTTEEAAGLGPGEVGDVSQPVKGPRISAGAAGVLAARATEASAQEGEAA